MPCKSMCYESWKLSRFQLRFFQLSEYIFQLLLSEV
jgi:hypothetical protein